MQIQSNLGSTIAMAFDECPNALADRQYVTDSVNRTTRWLERCKKEMARLNSLEDTINKEQLLFGINQGAIYPDIRIDHAKRIAELDLDGYAVGGLAVVSHIGRDGSVSSGGQADLSDGGGHTGQYSRGRRARSGLFRLRIPEP